MTDSDSIQKLIAALDSPESAQRVAASASIVRLGSGAGVRLEQAGARPAVGLAPSRLDLLYTLMTRPTLPTHRTDSLGLRLGPGVSRAQVEELGRVYGFVLPADQELRADTNPTCYVRVRSDRLLEQVMTDLLTREPRVDGACFDAVD